MKILITLVFIILALFSIGQNIGINQNSPTNSLHISPFNTGDNPLRIDGLQPYTIGDSALLIIDNNTGVVKYINTSDFVNIISNGSGLGSDNQNIDSLILNGYDLTTFISNGNSASVNLFPLVDSVSNSIINNSNFENQIISLLYDNADTLLYNSNFINNLRDSIDTDVDSLVLNNTILTIYENGTSASVDLSFLSDNDSDPTNEIQTISKTGSTVTLSNSGGSFTDDDTQLTETQVDAFTNNNGYLTSFTEIDGSITNEIQNLSLSGSTLSISSGNNVNLSTFLNNQNLSNTISGNNVTIAITNGSNTVFSINDADSDPSNEYNTTFSLSGTNISITDGGGTKTVSLSPLVDHDWYEAGSTSPNNINDNIYTLGKVSIGSVINYGRVLNVIDNNIPVEIYVKGKGMPGDPYDAALIFDDNGSSGNGYNGQGIFMLADYGTTKSEWFAGKPSSLGYNWTQNFGDSYVISRKSLANAGHDKTVADPSNILMRINSAGNVGLSTLSQTEKLNVNGNIRLGITNSGPIQPAGYGNSIIFSGAPDVSSIYDGDNSDIISISRYNITSDQSELRVRIGDNTQTQDAFTIGYLNGSGWFERFRFETTGVAKKPGGGSWATTSDRRTKKNIIEFSDGLNVLNQINPVTFKYNGLYNTNDDGKDYVGIIAQDVQKIAPYMIGSYEATKTSNSKEMEDILNYDGGTYMLYVLVNSVKEQQQQIEELKRSNELLIEEIKKIKN